MGMMNELTILSEEDAEGIADDIMYDEIESDHIFRLYSIDRKNYEDLMAIKAHNREQYEQYGTDGGLYVCCICKSPRHWGKSGIVHKNGIFFCKACAR